MHNIPQPPKTNNLDPFGGDPFADSKVDPFGSKTFGDPFKGSSDDPFSSDPFGATSPSNDDFADFASFQ
uniref:Epidermal growth factor receptor substrate 15-like 1 n=1 Tax=Steinernema glaseri TaxID=37863 RepID=A0A1I7Y931_9BILA